MWINSIVPPDWAEPLLRAMESREIRVLNPDGQSRYPNREAMFIAQCAHESAGFTRFDENLNYSAERLLQVFPKYFKNSYEAQRYAHNRVAIGSRIYANRMGNRDEASGDGWRFRGRGCIQLTGRNMYEAAGAALRLPLVTFPDHVEHAHTGAPVAAWYWHTHGCNALADRDDFVAVTKAINGGVNGLADRQKWLKKIRALQGA